MNSTVYLVPSVLDDAATETIPAYILDAVKKCTVIFAENERTTRRFLKSICKEINLLRINIYTNVRCKIISF